MNRVELIKSLVGRKVSGVPKGAGLSRAADGLGPAIPRKPYRERLGVVPFRSDGLLDEDSVAAKRPGWAKKGSLKTGATFKESERHQAHHLTRIAERLKRGWH